MNRRLVCLSGIAMLLAQTVRADDTTTPPPEELRTKSGGRVWVYLPKAAAAGATLGCVVVPPAGSRLFHGMSLSEGDRDEHTPYVAAGFAVISFDISGPWPDSEGEKEVAKAVQQFTKARCGVTDAIEAIQTARGKFPQIDGGRIYVAGHSSAGTLALQLAAAYPQFKGCIAFAPVIDLEGYIGSPDLKSLEEYSPGLSKLIKEMSPANQIDAVRCPLFLFSAADDDAELLAPIKTYAEKLTALGREAQYVQVPNGGHYDSMIEQGLPKAVAWLKAVDQKLRK